MHIVLEIKLSRSAATPMPKSWRQIEEWNSQFGT